MIYTGMRSGIFSLIVSLLVAVGCGGGGGRYDCHSTSEAINRLCDVFNSGSGPLKFIIDSEYGPTKVGGEISSEGSGAGEILSAQGHLLVDIDPQTDRIYLSGIHIQLSDFIKGVG